MFLIFIINYCPKIIVHSSLNNGTLNNAKYTIYISLSFYAISSIFLLYLIKKNEKNDIIK